MARVAGCLCVLVAVTGTASAQRVTIDVKDAPVPEVAALLRDVTGVDIYVEAWDKDRRRVTLKFDEAPLKQVIKELCRQTRWQFQRVDRAYRVADYLTMDHRPRCVVDGYEVLLTGVVIARHQTIDLRDRQAGGAGVHALWLGLVAEADTWEAMVAVFGFDPAVRALTDTGTVLAPLAEKPSVWYSASPTVLDPPPPGAKRLATLEGDLVLYADLDRAELEFAIDDIGRTKEAGDLVVTFEKYDEERHTARFTLVAPDNPPEQQRHWPQPRTQVVLIGADGTRRACLDEPSRASRKNGVCRFTQWCEFRVPDGFRPAKMHYRVIIPRNPTRRLSYRFEDIPLPTWEGEK